MPSGFASASAWKVETEFVKSSCPNEFKNFEETLGNYEISFDEFAKAYQFEEPEEIDCLAENKTTEQLNQDIAKSWGNLQKAFRKATKVGNSSLLLFVMYHSSESGDCYDDVDGAFFGVDGVMQMSPAGKKFKDHIEKVAFVEWG